MKKCPFCGAEIEQEAAFCLYCMQSLEEKQLILPKKKRNIRWLWIPIGVLILALVIVLWPKGEKPPVAQEPEITDAAIAEATGGAETRPAEGSAEPPQTQATQAYHYRAARQGDDFSAGYSNSGNDIVITGVARYAADGVYDIPAYIDGKRVIAITANAFSGSGARVVYLPSTVKTVWNYAFAGCNVTQLYIRGSAVYIEAHAFGGIGVILCSASCHDRSMRTYSSCAESYGASWEEWNG